MMCQVGPNNELQILVIYVALCQSHSTISKLFRVSLESLIMSIRRPLQATLRPGGCLFFLGPGTRLVTEGLGG